MVIKKTVLIIGPTPPPMGGIATYVGDMLNSSIRDTYNVLHLNTARAHDIKKSLTKNIVLFSKNSFRLIQMLWFKKPEIVHIHTSSYSAFWEKSVFIAISKLFRKKVVVHIHGAEFDKFYNNGGGLHRYLIKRILNTCDTVIVLSMRWKEFFLGFLGEDKISVVQNGIVLSRYDYSENSKTDNAPAKTRLLFMGNLVQRKGVYDILKSIPAIVAEFDNVEFIFAGSEERSGEIDKLKGECIVQDIESYVTFRTNFSDDEKIELLNNSDIYLLPSYAEGLPISLLEAMAVGLPIISTPVGGIPEVIGEGENGFLVSPGDYVSLGESILKLIRDPQLAESMRVNNRRKIVQVYNWDVIADKIVSQYNKLVG